jgi:hypothetical protein
VQAGISPLNTSIVDTVNMFNLTATAEFWWYFPALLTDTKRVKSVAPITCSGEDCSSYYLPGSMTSIVLDPNQPPISKQDFPSAVSYIQNDAPGYQLDFYPIDAINDPSMTLDDCRVYGVAIIAIQICLKETRGSLLAGTPLEMLMKLGTHAPRISGANIIALTQLTGE